MLFLACMNYRKQLLKEQPEREQVAPIYTHLTDLVDKTLCPKIEGNQFRSKTCCDRECVNCGVSLLQFLPEEESTEENGTQVKWQ